MINLLFINAISNDRELEQRYPSLGLGYLASSLQKKFANQIDIKIIDSNVDKEINNFRPDIVGISAVSQNYGILKKYAEIAKKNGCFVIVGGVHVSYDPKSIDNNIDIAILGEGEQTIVEVVDAFMSKQDFSTIKGIAYHADNKVMVTTGRPPINPLDQIPLPARELLEIKKHTYMFSSRGCPYRCVFCSSSRYWESLRFFSAEYVVNEIKHLVDKYHVELISFYDDLFIADKQRIKDIIRLLKERSLLGKIKYSCSCRANLISKETVDLLKEMGVVSVGMGLESGCEKTLKYLKGDSVTVKDNHRAIKLLKRAGIAANASFVIGSPNETKEDIMETYNFIKNSELDIFDVYLLTPLPGTPIWDAAKKKGLVNENIDWSRLDVDFSKNKTPIIMSEVLSKEELIKLYKLFQRLRLRFLIKNGLRHPFAKDIPRYVFQKTIERLFGIKTAFRQYIKNLR